MKTHDTTTRSTPSTRTDPTTGAAAESHPEVDSVELEERISRDSPEGPPADPTLGAASFAKFWMLLALSVLIIGVVLSFIIAPWAGITVAAVGLVSLVINPQVLAGLLRSKERDKAHRDLEAEHQRTASR
ncbi:MAG: hypothetical protein ACTS3F_13060 [Phycisphaerales bacterium]